MKNRIKYVSIIGNLLMAFLLGNVVWSQDVPIPQLQLSGKLLLKNLNSISDIKVHDSLAFIMEGTHVYIKKDLIRIIDFSNPSKPTQICEYNLPPLVYSSLGSDLDWPYFYVPIEQGFDVLDVSRPASPKLIGEYRIQDTTVGAGIIAAHKNQAVYAHYDRTNIETIDLQNPATPKRVGIVKVDNSAGNTEKMLIMNMIWDGSKTAYLTVLITSDAGISARQRGLVVLDASDFDHPKILSRMTFPLGDDQIYMHLFRMFRLNNLLLIADMNYGMHVIDIHNPAEPVISGFIQGKFLDSQNFFQVGPYCITQNLDNLLLFSLHNIFPVFLQAYPSELYISPFAGNDHTLVGIHPDKVSRYRWFQVYNITLPSAIELFESFQ